MKALRSVGLTVAIVVGVYILGAIFTYPTGVAAAVTDPWEAITLLAERVTNLEWRVARVEKLLGLDQEASPYTEEDVRNSPLIGKVTPGLRAKIESDINYLYSLKSSAGSLDDYYYIAKVPTELTGKIRAKYNFWIEVSPPWEKGLPIRATLQMHGIMENLSSQPLSISYTAVWTLKDESGVIIQQWVIQPLPGDKPIILEAKENKAVPIGLSAGLEDVPRKLDVNSISVELELKDIK